VWYIICSIDYGFPRGLYSAVHQIFSSGTSVNWLCNFTSHINCALIKHVASPKIYALEDLIRAIAALNELVCTVNAAALQSLGPNVY
jgi:hypothetical protein